MDSALADHPAVAESAAVSSPGTIRGEVKEGIPLHSIMCSQPDTHFNSSLEQNCPNDSFTYCASQREICWSGRIATE